MISPVPGTTLTSSSVTFTWTAVAGATGYFLSTEVFSNNVGTDTSKLLTGLPTDGAPVYVTLITLYPGGVYAYERYLYSPAGTLTKAAMQSPAPGSVLSGPNVTFNWSQGIGPSAYRLTAGFAGPGSDTLGLSASSATTQLVTGLPTDGSILYVRLFSLIGDVWQFNDYTYTTATGSIKGAMQSPAPGSTLAAASVTFNWSAGSGAAQYRIDAGSIGFGSSNLFSLNSGTATTQTISGLPRNESNVYVRLWSLVGGNWQYNDYVYSTATGLLKAELQSPAPGFVRTPEVTFTWSTGLGATQYHLYVGTAGVGSHNIVDQNTGSATTLTVNYIPTGATILYVRL